MATKISGIVTEIKARSTRVGDMYDVVVNGVAYGNGKYPPRGIKAGDFVTFEAETKQNGQYTNYNIVPRTIRVDDKPSVEAVSAAKAQTSINVAAADKRQETISKQANLNTALQLVSLYLQHGGVKLPAKAPDCYTAINALVSETASKLYAATTGESWELDLSSSKQEVKSENMIETDEYDS